jgi:hypothetical protein
MRKSSDQPSQSSIIDAPHGEAHTTQQKRYSHVRNNRKTEGEARSSRSLEKPHGSGDLAPRTRLCVCQRLPDGRRPHELYLAVLFENKETYVANANRPGTNADYEKMMQFLVTAPEWHDGKILHSH